MKHNIKKDEINAIQQATNKTLWWYCDNCEKGIQPLTHRFDCLECPDYTICKNCYELKEHSHHKRKKFIIPDGCFPPTDEEIQEILQTNFFSCYDCNAKLDRKSTYYQHKTRDDV